MRIALLICLSLICLFSEGQNLLVNNINKKTQSIIEDEASASQENWSSLLGFDFSSKPSYPDAVYSSRIKNLDSDIKLEYNEYVRPFIEHYSIRRRDVTEKALGYSTLYFPVFDKMLGEANMPIWLKYLAVAESTLDPSIESSAAAVGLWQFISGTGQMYGLKENYYIDDRRDPIKATAAAINHLQDLYDNYGDWYLVFAAYNSGAGNVNKAIRRSGGKKDYWEIRRYLPAETRGYVPSFIAACYIMNHTEEHNLKPFNSIDIPSQIDTVIVKGPLSFAKISESLEMNPDLLSLLNPAFKKAYVPGDRKEYKICVPSDMVGDFIDNKLGAKISAHNYVYEKADVLFSDNASPSEPSQVEIRYVFQENDNPDTLAKVFGTSVEEFKTWNNIKDSIAPGTELVFQVEKSKRILVSDRLKAYMDAKSSNQNKEEIIYHVIQEGDTIYKLNRIYNDWSVQRILKENGLKINDVLPVGVKVKVGGK